MFKPVESNPSFPKLEESVLRFWQEKEIFKKTVEDQDKPTYSFFEGPPTANGTPGIHHVQARAYKDLFPRFKTMQGYYVPRKAGWDTHGLPVELGVEKRIGLSSKREVEEYGIAKFNQECRDSVFVFEDKWREFTERMGYWLDLDNPYMTLHKDYIESIWWSLKELNGKGLLYKGFRVAPYCPKDGTTLSNAEVSDGYKDIQDPSIYLTFDLKEPEKLGLPEGSAFLVWTTTPWTIPYNVGVAIHPEFEYTAAKDEAGKVLILASSLKDKVLGESAEVVTTFKGSELERVAYTAPYSEAYEAEGEGKPVWFSGLDTYVSDSDGTGIVHTAPAFGEDDLRLARNYGFPVIVGVDNEGKHRFGPWQGVFFRDANSQINRDLKEKGFLWKLHNFNHSYPHCWRCGTPLMYYATESWFIANTKYRERLIELNQTVGWHPEHIKNGRYGGWLENLVDWNLSRNRFWGTPLPVWETESGKHYVVGSYAELAELSRGAVDPKSPDFDPHRPMVDDIVLFHPESGEPMKRVPYVIDVWYDSGAMPFAQYHYPFENKEVFEERYPADFISEAIDQTRGWFNTLHQIGTMLFDSVTYKDVICCGHILDEKGFKMSKSKGNIVDPWEMFSSFGADAVRWYMYTSAPPELSRRFGPGLVGEALRNYLLTLWNTYSFFVMYANLDKPDLASAPEVKDRPEVDRWLIAQLQVLIEDVTKSLEGYDPTTAGRLIQDFVVEDLSNWYVRRNRRRFWKSDGVDLSAYATLHEALVTVTHLTAPFTPFIAEVLYQNLVLSVKSDAPESVHMTRWPTVNEALKDSQLVDEMNAVIRVVALGRAVRGQNNIKNRQPLPRVLLRARSKEQTQSLGRFVEQIKEELNVKEVELLDQYADLVQYTLKPNLPVVGKKVGKQVPVLKKALDQADASYVARMVRDNLAFEVEADGVRFELQPNEVLVDAKSPEGYAALEDQGYLVAFDTQISRELELEGLMRDIVRSVQNARKDAGLEVSDRIRLTLDFSGDMLEAAQAFRDTIAEETLSVDVLFSGNTDGFVAEVEGGKLAVARA
ncbi:isoleucine--tRNA ligase [Deinococcus cellulosilyticus]|uniref:Isoleucine--tRNA ligase n=1 Tax=Deinococcus cellulosilyticus (strain DSM 18568 / NBRC 106333 / KACC 11606 / 5516J-15) TaxID=1223518 RepID=A0A511N5Z0_DEIC1|nr:isoleucine--tRNA ligase [Deinococcus cellulosilyticus]GEM48275.1 isoleucine--tRNA ligase [Deinococcus cellulosilyticus NBRC 106333 = KACC 11606]